MHLYDFGKFLKFFDGKYFFTLLKIRIFAFRTDFMDFMIINVWCIYFIRYTLPTKSKNVTNWSSLFLPPEFQVNQLRWTSSSVDIFEDREFVCTFLSLGIDPSGVTKYQGLHWLDKEVHLDKTCENR